MLNTLTNLLPLVEDLVILAIVVGAVLLGISRRWSLGRLFGSSAPMADSENSSQIFAYYSAGQTLTSAGRGELGGMRFSSYISTPLQPDQSSSVGGLAFGFSKFGSHREASSPDKPLSYINDVAAIFVLDLPFNTSTHVIGLSKEHKIDRLQFASFLKANGLTKVELEGDFDDYFDIYAAEGQDVQVREVLNPKSMEYVVDYCRTHFWEINASELYIVATDADKSNDDLISASQNFVNQIKPALLPGEPGAAVVHHETPYGEYDGPPLPCPICQKQMAITGNWMACPDGHGALLDGKDLTSLHDGNLRITADASKSAGHGALTCPNCHSPMESVNYEETGNQIDVCTKCTFRWLDASDVVHLQPKVDTTQTEGSV